MGILDKIKGGLPVSKRRFTCEIQELKQELNQNYSNNIKSMERLEIALGEQNRELKRLEDISMQWLDNIGILVNKAANQSAILGNLAKTQAIAVEKNKQQAALLTNQYEVTKQTLNLIRSTRRIVEENMWSNVFHDGTRESVWLNKTEFVPGRWAIGYQTLYVLYRVLNELHPMSILELGLGQSTKMITQYVDANPGVLHRVVEHDQDWIDHYKTTCFLAKESHIMLKTLSSTSVNGIEDIRCYKNFEDGILPNTFDLIIIDGPWGGDMQELSRVDVAKIMPACLAKSFVIILDDYNRQGEQHTLEYMKTVLDKHNIAFSSAKYEGAKDMVVLTSADRGMVCTY